jgi:hypothetical protein
MGLIKDEIKELYKMHGGEKKAMDEVQGWFEKGSRKLVDKTLVGTSKPFKPGMIYVFKYIKPKLAEELPWWDKNPVVLALDPTDAKNDLGINLNLLPMKVRIELLDAVYTLSKSFIEKQKTGSTAENANLQKPIPKFTYDGAKKFLEKFGYEFAIRQYIPKLKSKQTVVAYERWSYIAICNLLEPGFSGPKIPINEQVLKKQFDEYKRSKLKKRTKK